MNKNEKPRSQILEHANQNHLNFKHRISDSFHEFQNASATEMDVLQCFQ